MSDVRLLFLFCFVFEAKQEGFLFFILKRVEYVSEDLMRVSILFCGFGLD